MLKKKTAIARLEVKMFTHCLLLMLEMLPVNLQKFHCTEQAMYGATASGGSLSKDIGHTIKLIDDESALGKYAIKEEVVNI